MRIKFNIQQSDDIYDSEDIVIEMPCRINVDDSIDYAIFTNPYDYNRATRGGRKFGRVSDVGFMADGNGIYQFSIILW